MNATPNNHVSFVEAGNDRAEFALFAKPARGSITEQLSSTQAATKEGAVAMNTIFADVFDLYLKAKNLQSRMSGPHFRDRHPPLDECADQPFAMNDSTAERIRKISGFTTKLITHISRSQGVLDNDAEGGASLDVIADLAEDNKTLAVCLLAAQSVCLEHNDIATASLIEVWIEESELRTWFLSEIKRGTQWRSA
jgi:starvation-inducible DNA-binding protein